MIRGGRFWRQAARHIGKDKRLSLGSFLVLFIILLLVDFFWLASLTINVQYGELLKTVRMEAYLSEEVPDSLLPGYEETFLAMEDVVAVDYVSQEEAALILANELGPGVLDGLEENPLPRSFILSFGRAKNLVAYDRIAEQLDRLQGVEAVDFGRTWIEKVETVGTTLRRAGYMVGGLILFVVLFTMANTNRLTARGKSSEFYQLKLLGAGPSYLLYPFLVEGFLSASLAAAIGWLAILYFKGKISFSAFALVLPGFSDIAVYCLLAGFTGLAGAYLGIRRFLSS